MERNRRTLTDADGVTGLHYRNTARCSFPNGNMRFRDLAGRCGQSIPPISSASEIGLSISPEVVIFVERWRDGGESLQSRERGEGEGHGIAEVRHGGGRKWAKGKAPGFQARVRPKGVKGRKSASLRVARGCCARMAVAAMRQSGRERLRRPVALKSWAAREAMGASAG